MTERRDFRQTKIIYAFTNVSAVRRALWLSRSVVPFEMALSGEPEQTVVDAFQRLRTHNRLVPGDPIVVVSDVATSHGDVTAIQVRTVD